MQPITIIRNCWNDWHWPITWYFRCSKRLSLDSLWKSLDIIKCKRRCTEKRYRNLGRTIQILLLSIRFQLKRKDKYRNLEYFTWFPLNLSFVLGAWFSSAPNLSEITGVAVKDTIEAIQWNINTKLWIKITTKALWESNVDDIVVLTHGALYTDFGTLFSNWYSHL